MSWLSVMSEGSLLLVREYHSTSVEASQASDVV